MADSKDKEKIAMEKAELDRMVKKGFDFSIEYNVTSRRWLLGKKKTEHKKETFHISEPTLGTLDRMSQEMIKMAEFQDFGKEESDIRMNELAVKYCKTACRAIAYAVVGEEYYKLVKQNGRTYEAVMEKRVDELAEVFMHTMRPSDLRRATVYVLAARNLPDFLSSIMLMSETRTSHPDMVEGKA